MLFCSNDLFSTAFLVQRNNFLLIVVESIIHRNGQKNRKRDRFNLEAWYKYMFLKIWVYLQRAVTKKRKKQNKKVLLLNKEKSEKGDEDSAFEW